MLELGWVRVVGSSSRWWERLETAVTMQVLSKSVLTRRELDRVELIQAAKVPEVGKSAPPHRPSFTRQLYCADHQ